MLKYHKSLITGNFYLQMIGKGVKKQAKKCGTFFYKIY